MCDYMFNPEVISVKYGMQVIFSTIPNNKGGRFEENIEDKYFETFKSKIRDKRKYPYLYKPLKYYMLGDYDVCYLSLINNFKFSHRLFEPKISDEENKHVYTHSFQSYSGFALDNEYKLRRIFGNRKKPIRYFIGIIQIKLNNGLLIGNGLYYIEFIYEYLKKIIKVPFLINYTFTWFEISLVVFINDPKELSKLIIKIRSSKLSTIKDEFPEIFNKYGNQILENSLFNSLYPDSGPANKRDFIHAGLFSDTNTHFGFDASLIKMDIDEKPDDYAKKFLDKANRIILKTEIEWQVKPGFINNLIDLLHNHTKLGGFFKTGIDKNSDNFKMVLGKCDFLIQETNDSILSNFMLIRDLQDSDHCNFFDFVRKIRTYVFLNSKISKDEFSHLSSYVPNSWDGKLDKLAVKTSEFNKIDKILKSLKVSRQIRIKIMKIFSNYNNGILDPILFVYFLDFKVFIDTLKESINYYNKISKSKQFKLSEFEKILTENIHIFEEGYSVRFINGYQFENISDFDLDINNSVLQLLSAYGTFVYEFGKNLIHNGAYYPVIQLSDVNTLSNYKTINYYVHHLTSPEFVFATLTKEILNHIVLDNTELNKLINTFKKEITEISLSINESYLDDMIKSDTLDIEYIVNDALRFQLTFDRRFDLFEHWFWSYIFQNATHYDSSGMFNEDRFISELFRLLFIRNNFKKFIKKGYDVKCPVPELLTYWDRHFDKMNNIVNEILLYSETKSPTLRMIMDFIDKILLEFDFNKIKVFNKMFFSILDIYYKRNSPDKIDDKYRIPIIRRNWKDGEIIDKYNSLFKNKLYAIDQTGGVYFQNMKAMQEYFEQNAKILLEILGFAFVHKKQFITNNIKE